MTQAKATTDHKPSRQAIEEAIHLVDVMTEDTDHKDGIALKVEVLRVLADAARWALVVMDFRPPPPPDIPPPKPERTGRATGHRGPSRKKREPVT